MNIKHFATALSALLLMSSAAFAQNGSKSDASVEFCPNWYIQAQGGAAYTLGEASFGKLLSPAAYLSIGYNFIPSLGVRVGVGGWQGKGAIVSPEQLYSYKFLQGNADLILNLSNLFGGFDHKRVCSPYLLGGVGVAAGLDNSEAAGLATTSTLEYLWDKKTFVAGRFGLGADFRLSDRLSLGLESNANVLSDHFNSKRAGNCDWQINLLAGLTYRFGKNYRTSEAYLANLLAAEEAARLARLAEEQRLEAERLAAEQKAEAERRAAEEKRLAEERLAAEQKAAAELRARIAAEHSDNVYFRIDSDYIRKKEAEKISALAAWLVENPEYKVIVTGYADKETGNPSHNLNLSERRARNVVNSLTKAGVDPARIQSEFFGDTVQPFDAPALNRVAVCTVK